MRASVGTSGHAKGHIERARLIELMRFRYGDAAGTALDRAVDDASLPDKAFYSPAEVDRIADEIALRPLERAELVVLLLRREAALAAVARGIVAETSRRERDARR